MYSLQVMEQNMIFFGVQNTWWKKKTRGFPANNFTQGTHPLFVLKEISGQGFEVCPCSSSKCSRARYVEKGCILLRTKYVMDRKSYIIDRFSFNLPVKINMFQHGQFMGKAPVACIKGSGK